MCTYSCAPEDSWILTLALWLQSAGSQPLCRSLSQTCRLPGGDSFRVDETIVYIRTANLHERRSQSHTQVLTPDTASLFSPSTDASLKWHCEFGWWHCEWGQSRLGQIPQPKVGPKSCHWECLSGTLSPRTYAIILPSLERPPAGRVAASIAKAISVPCCKSSTGAANRRCWKKSALFPANQMAP